MKYVFLLSKENIDIAKEEVLALLAIKKFEIINNIIIAEAGNNTLIKAKRLAYTNSIYTLLLESNYEDFLKSMESFDWNSVYKDNFCIRTEILNPIENKKIIINKIKKYGDKFSERKLAFSVWKKVKKPKVDLVNPETHIRIFFAKDKVFCCLLSEKIKHNFKERRSHLRPRPSPISLHPKLARAMVNLTGALESEVILDPFCGSGGILIEAGLMGMKTIGYDINKKMIWKSMVNLKYYNIKNNILKIKNFFEVNKEHKYIVSDLPYGLNTHIMQNIRVTKSNRNEIKKYLEEFYSKIIKKLEKILIKRAVIIFPNYFNYKKMIKDSKLKLKNEFEIYVHSNLTRKIVVLEK